MSLNKLAYMLSFVYLYQTYVSLYKLFILTSFNLLPQLTRGM